MMFHTLNPSTAFLEKDVTIVRSYHDVALGEQKESTLCNIFNVSKLLAVQDILNCILLSESVYRAHERGAEAVVEAFNLFQNSFTPGLVTITRIQCSLPHVQHRYVVGVSDDAMYVSFMGTKAMRDIISDVNYVQTAIWPGLLGDVSEVPTAHQGFLARSESVLVELLYAHASKQNKRLVLCGHSLGGAVAQLCALRLLHDLPPYLVEQGRVKCISFAAPPVGNSALANTVSYKGWSGLFYNLALPEDVVPRLMAMQNSVSLPAAAAEAMLTQSSGSRAASSHQGPPEEEDPAGSHDRSKPEEEVPQSEMAPESMHVPGDENGSEAPAETQVIQGQSRSEGPPGSPAQAWRSRLRSSLDRLRAFTADLAPSTSQPMQSIAPPPTSHATHQPAVPARDGHARPMGRAATFASTAARYLPIYMHIGSQHHLHAPPGEPPLRPSSRQNSAEDAETLAALDEQDGRAGAASESAEAALQAGSPEQQRASGDRSYLGLSVPAYRSYLSMLTYHRMFAMRRRAAALCAAAVGREWLFAMREAARPAELCDDIAPVLDVAGASSRVPPSRPQFPAPGSSGGQQSSRWPNLQWASTLGALTSFIQPTRQTVPAGNQQPPMSSSGPFQSWWPWQGREGSDTESSNGPSLEPQSASGLPQDKEDDAKQQRSATDSKAQASQPAPSLARWLWRPWDTGGDRGGMTDIDAAVETEPGPPPQQPRSRQWLSWAGGSGRSEDFPPTPSAQMPLRISVRGRGLASCTKARVLAAGGVWCPACIVSSPPIPSLHAGAHAGSPPYQDQAADVAQSAHWPHGTSLWDVGRRIGKRVRDRVAGRRAEQTAADRIDCTEELVLETVLPPAMAAAVERGLLAQQHDTQGGQVTGLLEVQLRSDFCVRRVGMALRPGTAWILSDSARGAEMLMGGLCAPPGLAFRGEAPPFSTALAGSVRLVSLWPNTPRAAAFSVMAGLVARHLRASTERQEGPLRPASNEVSTSKQHDPDGWQQGPSLDEQRKVPGGVNGSAASLTSRISRPAARALTRAATAAAAVIGPQTGSRLAAWTARAREGAGSMRDGLETRLRVLQHGRVWRALKAQPTPELLILCLRGSLTAGGRGQAGSFFGQVRANAGSAVSGNTGADTWGAFSGCSAKDVDTVRVLLDSACASGIPVLVVVMLSSQDSWERRSPLPLRLESASGGTLVLHEGNGQLGSSEAWQLKMAVHRAISDAVQLPQPRSKL